MKKILTLLITVALTVTISATGTLAWLNDKSEAVVNTFTIGKVAVELDEAKTDVYGAPDPNSADRVHTNTYILIPGHTYSKDPIVRVQEESEDCYVFVKVSNGIADFEKPGDTTITKQMEANGWVQHNGTGEIYCYGGDKAENYVVDTGGTRLDLPVFENFTIDGKANTVTGWSAIGEGNAVTLQACVVQADGMELANAYTEADRLLNPAAS